MALGTHRAGGLFLLEYSVPTIPSLARMTGEWNSALPYMPGDTITVRMPPSVQVTRVDENQQIQWSLEPDCKYMSFTIGNTVESFVMLMESDPNLHSILHRDTRNSMDSFVTHVRVRYKCWFSDIAKSIFHVDMGESEALGVISRLTADCDAAMAAEVHKKFIDSLALLIDGYKSRRYKPCRATRQRSAHTMSCFGLRSPLPFSRRQPTRAKLGIKEQARQFIEQRNMRERYQREQNACEQRQTDNARSRRESRRRPLQEEFERARAASNEARARSINRYGPPLSNSMTHNDDAVNYGRYNSASQEPRW